MYPSAQTSINGDKLYNRLFPCLLQNGFMLDPRVTRLADLLCTHSTELNADDKVLIHAFDIPEEAVAEFVRVARSTGAQVAVRLESSIVRRQMLLGITDPNIELIAANEKYEMENMTAYLALRGAHNVMENSDVPREVMSSWDKLYSQPVVFQTRVPKTKWVALRWPTPSMAQQAACRHRRLRISISESAPWTIRKWRKPFSL
jgi:aminopeptidase